MTHALSGLLPRFTALQCRRRAVLLAALPLMVATSASASTVIHATSAASSAPASVSSAAAPSAAALAALPGEFSEAQKAQIGEIAANWLVEHPEYLVAASDSLRQQQQAAQQQVLQTLALQNAAALLEDGVPSVGPRDARAAVVMFFDYQCIYCSKMSPVVEKLRQANPDVRFIFREYPIFASRWVASGYAARVGEAVWAEKGGDAYLRYHNALFGLGKVEGRLTVSAINAVARTYLDEARLKQVADGGKNNPWQQRIDKNMTLGETLQLSGTPAFVVLPTQNATAETLTVIGGATTEEALRQAILKATPAPAVKK